MEHLLIFILHNAILHGQPPFGKALPRSRSRSFCLPLLYLSSLCLAVSVLFLLLSSSRSFTSLLVLNRVSGAFLAKNPPQEVAQDEAAEEVREACFRRGVLSNFAMKHDKILTGPPPRKSGQRRRSTTGKCNSRGKC